MRIISNKNVTAIGTRSMCHATAAEYGDAKAPSGCDLTTVGFRPTMTSMLANNKMQQTRSGHPRWRPSLLILVLGGR